MMDNQIIALASRESMGQRPHPHCEVCNRPVDQVYYETPIETLHSERGYAQFQHTGEIIVTIRCHGAIWKASNWRGIMELST